MVSSFFQGLGLIVPLEEVEYGVYGGSYFNIPKAIFYLHKGVYRATVKVSFHDKKNLYLLLYAIVTVTASKLLASNSKMSGPTVGINCDNFEKLPWEGPCSAAPLSKLSEGEWQWL